MTLQHYIDQLKKHKGWKAISALGIILLAGVLIEIMSLGQYNYAHRLMEKELDYRIESELTLKSVRVRSILKSNERMMRNYRWAIEQQINSPENIYSIIRRLVSTNHDVRSSFVAFAPNYYPEHGRLFEPSCYSGGDSARMLEEADDDAFRTIDGGDWILTVCLGRASHADGLDLVLEVVTIA